MPADSGVVRILLVEDDDHDALAFRRAFDKSDVDCDIVRCARAEEALPLLKAAASEFAIVFTDYRLPDTSGVEFFNALRSAGITVPVVVITGSGSENIAVEALKAGVDDYVIKGPGEATLALLPVVFREVLRKRAERLACERAETALRRSEARYRDLVESTSDLVQSVAPDGSLLFVNNAWRHTLGYDEEDIRRLNMFDVIHPSCRSHCKEVFRRVLAGIRVNNVPAVFLTKDGRSIEVEGSSSCRFEGGNPVATRGIFRDVTVQREAEREIASLARFPEENLSPVLRIDRSGNMLYANPASAVLLAHFGCRIGGSVPDKIHDLVTSVWKSGEFWVTDIECGRRLFSFVITPVAGADYVNMYGHDITEQRRLEARLRQAHKMEAIGTLAGGIAHDFNNLLTGILGYANELKTRPSCDGDIREIARIMESAATRGAELTRQLLGFARKGKIEEVPLDVHKLINEVASVLRRTIDRRIDIVRELRAATPHVLGDPTQLQQVLLNLGVNARDAMPSGGRLVFETCVEDIEGEHRPEHFHGRPGRYLAVAVADSGHGIPLDIRDRIFDPYFTTKEKGKGTGLGLAMTYGIIRNHGGSILVCSEEGRGTTFKIYLPLSTETPPPDTAPRAQALVRGGGERVLVVEDEEVIRTMVTRMLEGLGYRVATAADGQEGAEYYARHADEIDLVIVDMIMPKMDGRECFHRLKEIDPEVKTVLSTGCGLDSVVRGLLSDGMVGHVQKPYHAGQLADVVAKALGRDQEWPRKEEP